MQTLGTMMPVEIDKNEVEQGKMHKETKRCPFCAEIILAAAIKCKHCGEFLNAGQTPPPVPNSGKKWHQSNTTIILALLTMGPFALPMVWLNKRYSIAVKAIITTVVVGVTLAAGYGIIKLFQNTFDQIRAMGIDGL